VTPAEAAALTRQARLEALESDFLAWKAEGIDLATKMAQLRDEIEAADAPTNRVPKEARGRPFLD
jgi:hypothetical protein